MFPVTEVMVKDVVTVRRETPILEAARLLVEKGITGVPVIDGENNLVGLLSEYDILRLLVVQEDERPRNVENYMSHTVLSFEDTVSVTDICDFFLENVGKRRVPITHNGKLVGLVSRSDILKLIVRLRHISA